MSDGFPGQAGPTDGGSPFNAVSFVVQQMLARSRTMTLVKVVAVHDGGNAVAVVGTVDVQPLVNQLDGLGNSTAHGTVFGLTYFRLQSGAVALIWDPAVGDVGLAVISDRDISAVKTTKAQANPGSYRRFDLSDGVYLGGVLNAVPTTYIRVTADGFEVKGKLAIIGDITATGEITAGSGGADSVTLQLHKHAGVTTGSGSTAVPTPGT